MGTKPKAKRELGRPSSFRKEFVVQAQKLCELGATEFEIAQFFKVTTVTLWRWRAQYADFCNAMGVGKEKADNRVEASLYHRAVGYNFHSEKVMSYQGDIIRAPIVEHVPPDVGAASLWLRNRRAGVWRDAPDPTINVLISLADLVNSSYRPDLPALAPPKDETE